MSQVTKKSTSPCVKCMASLSKAQKKQGPGSFIPKCSTGLNPLSHEDLLEKY